MLILTTWLTAIALLAYACYDVVTKRYPRLWWLRVTGVSTDATVATVILIAVFALWRH